MNNKSVIHLAGVICPVGLVIRPAGKLVHGKALLATLNLYLCTLYNTISPVNLGNMMCDKQ